jgi:hypothetical protein
LLTAHHHDYDLFLPNHSCVVVTKPLVVLSLSLSSQFDVAALILLPLLLTRGLSGGNNTSNLKTSSKVVLLHGGQTRGGWAASSYSSTV